MKIKAIFCAAILIWLAGCNSNDNDNTKLTCSLDDLKKIKNIVERQAMADRCAQDGSNIVISKPKDWGNGPFDPNLKKQK